MTERGQSGQERLGKRLVLLVCLALLCPLIAAPLSADTWYEEYDRGLKRLRKGDAAAAAAAFQSALASRASPGRRVRAYGVRYIDYYPHLMLGRAYLELSRFEEAVEELEAALSAGSAPSAEVRSALQRARQEVARRSPPPAPGGVRAEIEGVGGRVRLTWEGAAGAEYYEVQSSFAGESWPVDQGVRASKNTALLIGLQNGEVRGRVRAVSDTAGAGPWSEPVSVTLAVGQAEAEAAGAKFEAGRSSMAGGRFTEAAAALTEAAEVLEKNAGCLAMIGTCHATLHFLKADPARKTEALRWYRRVLEVDPEFRLDERRVSPKIVRLFEGLR